MLSNFRAFAQSPLALVIIVLLVLGFALYGVGGIFTGSGTAVVVVGQEQISQRELAQSFERELQTIQQTNPDVTREQALEAGFGDQVLQRLIVQAAFYAKARELGLVTSDRALATELRTYQAFLNPVTGALDTTAYRSALQNARIVPAEFERSITEDMTRAQLAEALTSGNLTPTGMAATRYLVQQEQRRIRALILDDSAADAIPDPTDEQLQTFIEAHPDQTDALGLPVFTAPEFRAITLVRFRLEDYIADVEIDEAVLRETYEYQVDNGVVGTPAQRSFTQLTTPDETTANQIATRLAAGESAQAIATELGLDAPLTQTDAQAYQVPDSRLATAVFAMADGDTGAIEGSFGWSAVRIDAATDAVVPSFEDQLDALRTEAARAEATNAMYDSMAAFEQERANGATLEDASQRAGVPLEAFVPLDQYARAQDGEIDFLRFQALASDILPIAFDQFAGFAIDLQQYNETDWFTLRVDDIIPSQPRTLDEVRDQATEMWRASETDSQLQARADEALAQLQAGDDMEVVVLTAGGRIETSTLKRDETAGSFTANVVGQAFSMEPGQPALAQRRGPGPHMVLIVDEIIPADLAQAGLGEIEQRAAAIADEINDDILVSAQTALLNEYEIDASSVDQRLRASALGETVTP
ncbi:SurA N-terminal domain-containing protein [Maricaulis sp.]|uniref:peptidylprolyl isomerase n=1 Tax=Maricaulis sp. TaxID=1486257 RepID=UPI003A947A81